jgi:hypothetical protein
VVVSASGGCGDGRNSHRADRHTVTLPPLLPGTIDAVLALIDDPARWPATGKGDRAGKALRKALVTAIDVLKADAVLATGKAVASFEATPSFVSRGLKDAPAALLRAFTNTGNRPLGLADLDHRARLAPL